MEDTAMLPMLRRSSTVPSLWEELLSNDFWPTFSSRNDTPAVNITEDEKTYKIEVAAPGLKKEDFKVNLDENVLTISSEKKDEKEEKKNNYLRREFSYSSFSRSFILPDGINPDKIEASHENGVLHINIPKPEEAKKITRNIKVA